MVKHPVTSLERGKDGLMTTTNRTYSWSYVADIPVSKVMMATVKHAK